MKLINLCVPKLGMDTTEALLGTWFVKAGDDVELGTPLFELESEKVTFVVEAEQAGKISQLFHLAGEMVPVGEVVGILETE